MDLLPWMELSLNNSNDESNDYRGVGSVPLDSNKYSKGSTVIVKGNTGNMEWRNSDNKTEKLFNGWNTQSNGNGISYT